MSAWNSNLAAWPISPPAGFRPNACARYVSFSRGSMCPLDYSRQDVLVFSVGEGEMPGTPSVNPQIKVAKPPIVAEEPLQAEIRSFLACVRTRSQPLVSFEDGRRALALALDIVAAIKQHSNKVQLDQLHGRV